MRHRVIRVLRRRPWQIVAGPEPLAAGWGGPQRIRFVVRKGQRTCPIIVVFDVDGLSLTPGSVGGRVAATLGRSAVEPFLAEARPPRVLHIAGDEEIEPGAVDDPASRTQEFVGRRGPRGVARMVTAHGGELARALRALWRQA
jgi:hypothetical protein